MKINEKISQYRDIRKQVWFDATKVQVTTVEEHLQNQHLFQNFVTGLCSRCQLKVHSGTDEESAKVLWHKMWTVIRYAGIRSNIATNEILSIQDVFDNYQEFLSLDWNIEKHGSKLLFGGNKAIQLRDRTGLFEDKKPIANWSKNQRTVSLARNFNEFMKNKVESTSVIDFITGGMNVDNIWGILEHLQLINYKQRITALHLMMDLGFQTVKPDIVLSRIFMELGWTKDVILDLPSDITIEDLSGKGKYGGKYHYTNPKMYKPVIELARTLVKQINKDDLKADIGWVTDNPIREFDFFIVKFGQEPEPSRGIVKKLFNTGTYQCVDKVKQQSSRACR
ncbi:hypothetical protein [Photobacterium carnosum]|jgi:hypothetical protein|uniref:hypothetical protein n=1 Tax=Photobacterium carnosum TaxID=2023717 RepID=UPI001E350F66|nr:hypothetical protein [Photobacterium carnosum]MCD9496871.1 hypothetical protein [Photobacterium carnosum]MCD9517062.1 hypothetical protein [Photobacterium carnosum]